MKHVSMDGQTVSPLVVIVGPTASGKSALAMDVAKKYNGEIICADSRTVYRGMDIGTAKPTKADQLAVRHHLLDVVEPGQPFNVAEFKNLAEKAITDIAQRKKLPILVGGSGLYIDSVLYNYQFGPAVDSAFRAELEKLPTDELCTLCTQKNIKLPANIRNRRHLIRAIELGGLLDQPKNPRGNTLVVGITAEKEILKTRIQARAHEMFASGVLEETRAVGAKYGWDSESMTGNIYRILRRVIDGEINVQSALEDFVKSDVNLAKRQMTWFKRNPSIYWSDDKLQLITRIDQFIIHVELDSSF